MNTHTCNLTDKSIPLQTNPYPPLPSSLITRGDDNWPGPRISTERGRGGEREGGREGERGRERERGGGGRRGRERERGGRERERARPFPGCLWGEGLQKYGPLYEASDFSISTSSIAHV